MKHDDTSFNIEALKSVSKFAKLNNIQKKSLACDVRTKGKICNHSAEYEFYDQDNDYHTCCIEHREEILHYF